MSDIILKILTTVELLDVIKEARASNTLYLNNLDLTRCELRNISFKDFSYSEETGVFRHKPM